MVADADGPVAVPGGRRPRSRKRIVTAGLEDEGR
jgi:hypothetical protein